MPRNTNNLAELLSILAAEIDAADEAWMAAAENAFKRLSAVDPELARVAVRALHTSTAAAAFLARKFVYAESGNCYAALADAKRNLVIARLEEFIAGEAGSYV